MTFHLAVTDLQRLNSYLSADSYFQGTAKVRGNRDDYRPLRLNRRDHKYKQLRKYEMNGDVVYAARLYNTDLVYYHRDHIILDTTTNWTSNSTVAFMNAVLPHWIDITVHKNKFWVRVNANGKTGVWFMPDPTRKLKIMVDPINAYKPLPQHVQAMVVETRRVDRKAANQLYKPFKEYFQWAHAMFEMGAAEQMAAVELKYPVSADDHAERDENGRPTKTFWEVERDYMSNGFYKLKELVSGKITPDLYPKLLTQAVGCSRSFRTYWRDNSKLFYIDTTAKAHKAWLQKTLVDFEQAYKWEVRPNDRSFPSQVIRVEVSEQIRIGE